MTIASPLTRSERRRAGIWREELAKGILERHRELPDEGKRFTPRELDRQYALFRERFGPRVLAALGGPALLTFMHDGGNWDGDSTELDGAGVRVVGGADAPCPPATEATGRRPRLSGRRTPLFLSRGLPP